MGSAQRLFWSAEDGAKRRPQAGVGGADALDSKEPESALPRVLPGRIQVFRAVERSPGVTNDGPGVGSDGLPAQLYLRFVAVGDESVRFLLSRLVPGW